MPERTLVMPPLSNTSSLNDLGDFVQAIIENPHVFFVADEKVSARSLSATKQLYDIGKS